MLVGDARRRALKLLDKTLSLGLKIIDIRCFVLLFDMLCLPGLDGIKHLWVPLSFALVEQFVLLSTLIGLRPQKAEELPIQSALANVSRNPLLGKVFWDSWRVLLVKFIEVLNVQSFVVYV